MSKKEYALYAGSAVFLVFADYLFMRQISVMIALRPSMLFIWVLFQFIVLSVNGIVAFAYLSDGLGREIPDLESSSSLMAKARRTPSSDPYALMAEEQGTIQRMAYLQEKGLIDVEAVAEGHADIKVLGNLRLKATPTAKGAKIDLKQLVKQVIPPARPRVERSVDS